MYHPLLRFYLDCKKFWAGLIIIVVISFFAGYFKLQTSILWGQAIDYGMVKNIDTMLMSVLKTIIIVFFDCLRTALHYYVIGHVTEKMFLVIRERVYERITKGDVAHIERSFRTGDTVTRLNNDIEELNNFVAGDFSNFSRLISQGIFAVVGCLAISWKLALIYLVILPISIWLINRSSLPIQHQTRKVLDQQGSAMNIASDCISELMIVKVFGLETVMARLFGSQIDKTYSETVQSEKVSMQMTGIKYLFSVFQTILMLFIGYAMIANGSLSVGALLSFVILTNYINEPFEQLDYMIGTVRRAEAAAQRINIVVDIPNEKEGNVYSKQSNEPCSIESLSYTYDTGIDAVNNVSMHIAKNQHVAIVGESGSGKSTIVNLMSRLYLPQYGKIKIFGVDVADWNAEALRKNIAIVTQEAYLFDGSIYDNIAYGCPDVTREDCIDVLKKVDLWDWVCTFKDGLDHRIGEFGKQLSGGQQQRLCIARAMVKQASLILLDEATSSLDTQTEREIQKTIDKLLSERSAVIITHRITTIQNTDYVYVMEKGQVVEEGSPQDLFNKKGRYYRMCVEQGLMEMEI